MQIAPAATKRWTLDEVDFVVETSPGMTIRGRFDRVGGSYDVGADGIRIDLAVDTTSIDTGSGMWDALLRAADARALTGNPQVRFRSTRVRELGDGRLRIDGRLEAGGRVETVVFDAVVQEVAGGLRLEAAATVDRRRLGKGADRFAVFLPAAVHVTMRLKDRTSSPRPSISTPSATSTTRS